MKLIIEVKDNRVELNSDKGVSVDIIISIIKESVDKLKEV